MIMPETHRENRHRADAAQRKTCQTVQKPDINNNSIPDPEICESGSREFPALRRLLLVLQVGCVAMRMPELEQSCFWRSRN